MANHKSPIKRAKQNTTRNLRNKSNRTRVKNVIKGVRLAVSGGSADAARAALATAISAIDHAARKGAMHRNAASRKISRLTRQVNALKA